MLAAVAQGPGRLESRQWPEPELNQGGSDVLLELRAAGICHSDVDVVGGELNQGGWPLVPGHENMGVVIGAGAQASSVRTGDRVIVNPLLTCGRCERCLTGEETACERWFAAVEGFGTIGRARSGGFAQRMVVPERNVIQLPDAVPDVIGALLTDAGAVSFHAIRRVRPQPGDRVAIVGLGGLGRCSLAYLTSLTAVTVIAVDRDPTKVAEAVAHGAHTGIVAGPECRDEMLALTDGRGVDIAIEHTGSAAGARQAFDLLRLRGTLVTTSATAAELSVPLSRLSLGEFTVLGAHAALRSEIETAVRLVAEGRVDMTGIVSHRFALSELPTALAVLRGDTTLTDGPAIRMVIDDFSR